MGVKGLVRGLGRKILWGRSNRGSSAEGRDVSLESGARGRAADRRRKFEECWRVGTCRREGVERGAKWGRGCRIRTPWRWVPVYAPPTLV